MHNRLCKLLCNLYLLFFVGITVVTTQSDEKGHFLKVLSQPFENATGPAKIDTISFTEKYLERRIGRKINLKRLLSKFSSVCPIQESCGVDFNGLFSVDMHNEKKFSDCKVCTCGQSCVEWDNCCPGTHYGYFKRECVNKILYPHTKTSTSYMVNKCLDRYTSNITVIELCENLTRPCTGLESNITFKNVFCAQCYDEHDCVQWRLDVSSVHFSSDTFYPNFTSFSEIKSFIDKNGCIIQYKPPHWKHWGDYCDRKDNLKQIRIDKCNVTGLWQIYDADLEWACEHFTTPYKLFKNVFCYICNPSRASSQTVPQIDKCSIFENESSSFDSLIIEACRAFPAIERFWPFKNKYCYACSDGHNILKSSISDVFSLLDVSENNDQRTLHTQLTFSLVFDTPMKLERFLQENLKETFTYVTGNIKPHKSSKYIHNSSSIEKIINDYVNVCGAKTLCMDKVASGETDEQYGHPVCGKCACTTTCAEMENCCPDILVSKQPYSCVETWSIPSLSKSTTSNSELPKAPILAQRSYKIIDICLETDHPLAYNCSSYENNMDLLSNIPVGTAANVMYRNIYCYSCNNNQSNISLNLQAMCDTYIEHELFTEFAELIRVVKLHCHKISFVPLNSRQCKTYDPVTASYVGEVKYNRISMHSKIFEIDIIEPVHNLNNSVKTVYSLCNQTGYLEEHNPLMIDICETEAINLLTLPEYKIGNTVYKNFACFLCNPSLITSNIDPRSVKSDCQLDNLTKWFRMDKNLLNSLCRTTDYHRRWFPYKNMYCAECNLPPWQRVTVYENIIHPTNGEMRRSAYNYLFSLSPEDFERIEMIPDKDATPQCQGGTFDFSRNQCRLLLCNEGFVVFNTSCKPVVLPSFLKFYSISLRLIYSGNTDIVGYESSSNVNISKIDLVELCKNIIQMMTNSFDHITYFRVRGFRCRVPTPCNAKDNSSFPENVTFYNSISSSVDRSWLFFDISNVHFIDLAASMRFNQKEMSIQNITALLNLISKGYHLQKITDINGRLQSLYLHSVQMDDRNREVFDDTCSYVEGEQIIKEAFINVDKFLLCPYVKVNLSEAMLLDNQSLVLKSAVATFTKNEYKILDGHFIICADDYNRQTKKTTFADKHAKNTNVLNIFNTACTVISLVCLLLTFTVYCMVASIRTIPGKNIMLLCICLFCAQGFLQFGLHSTSDSALCICIGIGIHYFWMAAFCAMHVCSFHMFKIFYFNALSNEIFLNKTHLFIKYVLYIIFLPLVLVLVTVFSDSMSAGTVNAGYGENVCFISDFYIFVGTFLVPASLIFFNNFVFFILAFHSIRRSPNVPSNREKKNFFIFLKLCTIVGITWPLLLLDNVVNTTWFSFVVSGINSLQGVYIFCSFILNKRVVSLFTALFRKKTTDVTLRNTSPTSKRCSSSTSKSSRTHSSRL